MDKCFAENKGKCIALKKMECEGCNFYKTKKEAEEGRKKAMKRINSLSEEKKNHINEVYCGLK